MGIFSFGKNNFNNVHHSSIITKNGVSKVTINGKTRVIKGNNISISNNKIYVDGKEYIDEEGEDLFSSKVINITIEGDVESIDCAGDLSIKGNCGDVDCAGSCRINGDVNGDIDCAGSCNITGNHVGKIDACGSVNIK